MRISASNTYDIYHMSMSHYWRFRSLKCILIPKGRVKVMFITYTPVNQIMIRLAEQSVAEDFFRHQDIVTAK
jgi:hypothetical protein